MIKQKENKKALIVDTLAVIALMLSTVFLIWRAKFGIANMDESFYLTVPYRLINGDALFINEWHLSQMVAPLIAPFVWVYKSIVGSMDGIALADRYFFVFMVIATSIFIYKKLRKDNMLGALFASLIFSLYAPFCIGAICYNTLGIITLTIACLFVYKNNNKNISFFLSGIFLAFAVLCCPYLIALYVIYALAVLIYSHALKGEKHKVSTDYSDILSGKSLGLLTLGAGIIALIFITIVFSRIDLSQFFVALEGCFSDPEHSEFSLISKMIIYAKTILKANSFSLVVHIIIAILFIACIFDKKRNDHKHIYLALNVVTVIFFLITLFVKPHRLNQLMWPINLIAPIATLLLNTPLAKRLFFFIWTPGILYSIAINMSSNVMVLAITSASTVASVASIMLVALLVKDCLEKSKQNGKKPLNVIVIITVVALAITQIFTMIQIRSTFVFWDKNVSEQTIKIDEGFYKGLMVSDDGNEIYERMDTYNEIIKSYNKKKLLALSNYCMIYFFDDYEICAYSGWISGVNDVTLDRLELYYELNPDKYPEVVLVETQDREYANKFCDRFGYSIDYDNECIILTKAN